MQWLQSYLIGRQQFVKVGQATGSHSICKTGVPQGSVLGPLLFSVYISPISRLISSHCIQHHKYADDTTLYMKLQQKVPDFTATEKCIEDLARWFLENDMQLNPSKSEAMLVGSAAQLKHSSIVPSLTISDAQIPYAKQIKIIGITLDNKLSFNTHITNVCQESYFHIRALRHIRPLLDHATANTLACSIVHTRLDYCNSLLFGTSSHNINRLQLVQNRLARVVCQAPSRSSATELLKRLHWLPVKSRIEYKIAAITHKVIHDEESATYLQHCISEHKPSRNLRSANKSLLTIPVTKTQGATRAFHVSSPTVWNSLPEPLRKIPSHDKFKTHLKTHLFKTAFEP